MEGKEHPIAISLDMELEGKLIEDSFTWDMANPDNCPDQFAAVMASDLGLGPESEKLIAFDIRRQISEYTLLCAKAFKDRFELYLQTQSNSKSTSKRCSLTTSVSDLIYNQGVTYSSTLNGPPKVATLTS